MGLDSWLFPVSKAANFFLSALSNVTMSLLLNARHNRYINSFLVDLGVSLKDFTLSHIS